MRCLRPSHSSSPLDNPQEKQRCQFTRNHHNSHTVDANSTDDCTFRGAFSRTCTRLLDCGFAS